MIQKCIHLILVTSIQLFLMKYRMNLTLLKPVDSDIDEIFVVL